MPHFSLKCLCNCIACGQKCGEIRSSFFPQLCLSAHCSDRPAVFGQKRSGTVESPHSPYLTPLDNFAFPKLKFELEGDHYTLTEDIQKSVTAKLSVPNF